MQCPVCGGSATDHTPPGFDGIIVGCATCGNYVVADRHIDRLRALRPDLRREVLRKAKQSATFSRPVINESCF
jgi:hypothetical protein